MKTAGELFEEAKEIVRFYLVAEVEARGSTNLLKHVEFDGDMMTFALPDWMVLAAEAMKTRFGHDCDYFGEVVCAVLQDLGAFAPGCEPKGGSSAPRYPLH